MDESKVLKLYMEVTKDEKMMMTQIKLNKELYHAVTASEIDLPRIEDLLRLGADPLDTFDELDPDCVVIDELFADAQDEKFAKRLPDVVKLFLDNNMDVEKLEEQALHCLTWVRNEYGVRTWKLLLDRGLPAACAEWFIYDMFGDILQFEIPDSTKFNGWAESAEYAVKMAMLTASDERVIKSSQYIRDLVSIQSNRAEILKRFSRWDDYRCEFSLEESDRSVDCRTDLIDLRTGGIIWSFKFI